MILSIILSIHMKYINLEVIKIVLWYSWSNQASFIKCLHALMTVHISLSRNEEDEEPQFKTVQLWVLLWNRNRDGLGLDVLVDAFWSKFASVARLFKAAEWGLGCDNVIAIHPHWAWNKKNIYLLNCLFIKIWIMIILKTHLLEQLEQTWEPCWYP